MGRPARGQVEKRARPARSAAQRELYEKPADRFVAGFIGRSAFLDGETAAPLAASAPPAASTIACAAAVGLGRRRWRRGPSGSQRAGRGRRRSPTASAATRRACLLSARALLDSPTSSSASMTACCCRSPNRQGRPSEPQAGRDASQWRWPKTPGSSIRAGQ